MRGVQHLADRHHVDDAGHRQVDGAHLGAARLVVGAQHRGAAVAVGGRDREAIGVTLGGAPYQVILPAQAGDGIVFPLT